MTYITLKNLELVKPGTVLKARGCQGSFVLVLETPKQSVTRPSDNTTFHLNCKSWHMTENPKTLDLNRRTSVPTVNFLDVQLAFYRHQHFTEPTCVGWEIVDDEL